MAEKSVGTQSLALDTEKAFKGKRLRTAIIGCGGISQTYMNAFKSVPEVEVVAGCDINPDRLKLMADKWGVNDGYDDWKKMLKAVQPEAVCVLTPNGLHMQPTIDALNAGAHVMVEKPMAMNPAQCQKMIDAAKKANKKLAVGFQFRYHPHTQFLVRAREEDRFGKIMFAKCLALRRRGIPNWGVFGQKDKQGGGPMIDIGVHCIEMAHFAMGRPRPVAASGNIWTYMGNKPSNVVSAWPNWDYKTYTVEDLAVGQIRFENGALLQIEASFVAHIKQDMWNFTLMGEKGGASWDPAEIYEDRSGTMMNSTPGWMPQNTSFETLFISKLQNWVAAIQKNGPLTAPGEDGMTVQKMLDGIYRSAEAGKEVKID